MSPITESMPVEKQLVLKNDAYVIFTVNSEDGSYFNGEVDIVRYIKHDNQNRIISVTVEKEDGSNVCVTKRTIPYDNDMDKFIQQFPLRLAYAITIHKSQGMTFDRINIMPAGWEPGQLYVALSRAKTIDGIYLTEPITAEMLKADPRVIKFYNEIDSIV